MDCFTYGMLLPGRHGSTPDGYRYGFNGMEKDDAVHGICMEDKILEANSKETAIRLGVFIDPYKRRYFGSS